MMNALANTTKSTFRLTNFVTDFIVYRCNLPKENEFLANLKTSSMELLIGLKTFQFSISFLNSLTNFSKNDLASLSIFEPSKKLNE